MPGIACIDYDNYNAKAVTTRLYRTCQTGHVISKDQRPVDFPG